MAMTGEGFLEVKETAGQPGFGSFPQPNLVGLPCDGEAAKRWSGIAQKHFLISSCALHFHCLECLVASVMLLSSVCSLPADTTVFERTQRWHGDMALNEDRDHVQVHDFLQTDSLRSTVVSFCIHVHCLMQVVQPLERIDSFLLKPFNWKTRHAATRPSLSPRPHQPAPSGASQTDGTCVLPNAASDVEVDTFWFYSFTDQIFIESRKDNC